jgi:hypothetical protein
MISKTPYKDLDQILKELRTHNLTINKKQTAVEWLENELKNSKYYYKLIAEINSKSTIAQFNVFEQAKEMEKEQIIRLTFLK